jgi:hypothetical protein
MSPKQYGEWRGLDVAALDQPGELSDALLTSRN